MMFIEVLVLVHVGCNYSSLPLLHVIVPTHVSPHPVVSGTKSKSKGSDRPAGVGEVLLLGVESHIGGPSHPYLLALLDNELMVYRAFHYKQTHNTGHLQLRFSKVSYGMCVHLIAV